jgi:hypothetical protein
MEIINKILNYIKWFFTAEQETKIVKKRKSRKFIDIEMAYDIIEMHTAGVKGKDIAKEINVSESVVSLVIHGKHALQRGEQE